MHKLKIHILLVLMLIPVFGMAQDIVAGWTFSNGQSGELYAVQGSVYNVGVANLKALQNNGFARTIEYKNGIYAPGDFAAMASSWDNGANNKYWQIAFVSKDFRDLKLFSRQTSGESRKGPKYFHLQYRIGSAGWIDIPGAGTITVANDWLSGVVENLTLPAIMNDQSDSIYIRWIMPNNMNLDGDSVWAIGISKIDDIYIKGTMVTNIGVNEPGPEITGTVFPGVSSGVFHVLTSNDVKEVAVINSLGMQVMKQSASEGFDIDLGRQPEGLYFVVFRDRQGSTKKTTKIIVTR